jgi:hypothetical protein
MLCGHRVRTATGEIAAAHNDPAALSPTRDLFQQVQSSQVDNNLGLLARDAWKIIEESLQRVTGAQVVEKALDRHARPPKDWFSA